MLGTPRHGWRCNPARRKTGPLQQASPIVSRREPRTLTSQRCLRPGDGLAGAEHRRPRSQPVRPPHCACTCWPKRQDRGPYERVSGIVYTAINGCALHPAAPSSTPGDRCNILSSPWSKAGAGSRKGPTCCPWTAEPRGLSWRMSSRERATPPTTSPSPPRSSSRQSTIGRVCGTSVTRCCARGGGASRR